jgi:hypothetical protein
VAKRPLPAVRCSHADHELLKANDAAWRALPFAYFWPDGRQLLEGRQCRCGSTLCREVDTSALPYIPEPASSSAAAPAAEGRAA